MSLFKVREFWSILCDVDEKFDQSSLAVSKLNNDYVKIIVGSHSGILRIYQPSSELDENGMPKGYKAADLLVEKIYPQPILQVATGKLVSGSTYLHIAVLFPLSVAVFYLVTKESEAEHGVQNMLKLKYEHKLKRSSSNFVIGPFGGSQTRDFVCVQSLDGMLTFFEQESFSFCCFLPNFLLPGPLTYVHKIDSFLTVGSNWALESYSYKSLSKAGHESSENDSSGNKVASTWSYNLGESAIEIMYLYDQAKSENYIVVLGERNLFCLSSSGLLKFMKKLDFSPICLSGYVLEPDGLLTILVISETNTLLVYQNTTLKWSAQLPYLPISIRRADFRNVKGAIVLLSEDGRLDCCYLGTEPQLFTAPPTNNQELNFEKVEAELTSLNRIIKNYHDNDVKVANTMVERELEVSVNLNSRPNPLHNELVNEETEPKMCLITVDLMPKTILEEVRILIECRPPLKCTNAVEHYQNFNEKSTFQSTIYLVQADLEIESLKIYVIVSYVSSLGVPRVVKKHVNLPLRFVAETCPYSKDSEHKITININQNPVTLTTLFPEFIGENLTMASNAVGLRYLHSSGSPVTILSAKNSQRYRIQSDSLASLNVYVQDLILRLTAHFSKEENFKVEYTSNLPISQSLVYVKRHFEIRTTVNQLENSLNRLSTQFRIIQKRLISKFKDKNPTPLANLEKLLQDTLSEIIEITENLEIAAVGLEKERNNLSCVLSLLVQLLSLMDVNKDILPKIETAFSSSVYDLDGQGWEDTLDASLCHLLRTVFPKSERDKIKAAHSNFDEVTDVSKLEKHITQVLDRFVKFGSVENAYNEGKNDLRENKIEEEEKSPEKKEFLSMGNRLAESSLRVLSARPGTSRNREAMRTDKNYLID